jgi:hypothetical protein
MIIFLSSPKRATLSQNATFVTKRDHDIGFSRQMPFYIENVPK